MTVDRSTFRSCGKNPTHDTWTVTAPELRTENSPSPRRRIEASGERTLAARNRTLPSSTTVIENEPLWRVRAAVLSRKTDDTHQTKSAVKQTASRDLLRTLENDPRRLCLHAEYGTPLGGRQESARILMWIWHVVARFLFVRQRDRACPIALSSWAGPAQESSRRDLHSRFGRSPGQ